MKKKPFEISVAEFSKMSFAAQTEVLRQRQSALRLCAELDGEMDGVRCPKSVAAILNAIRLLVSDAEDIQ